MQDPIVVVGSGASAVHFSQTALELGRRVLMLDVGFPKPDPALPQASLNQLKAELDDPVRYFLGESYESLIVPGDQSEYYGFPPSKSYVFRNLVDYRVESKGFAPLLSFAQGGLAQAWTGGSYPFSEGELDAFPFGWTELEPHYSEIAGRIGISGRTDDDLAPYFPSHGGLMAPVGLDEHAARLLGGYERKRQRMNQGMGFYMGRARLATLSSDFAGRRACSVLGRCLWGCPTQSIYTPSITLELCRRHPNFEYLSGVRVDRFRYDDANNVTEVIAEAVGGGEVVKNVGTLVLAAGTLASARILLESLHQAGVKKELTGLMDNRQVLMPFINLGQLGRPFEDRSYQYHQLAIGVPGDRPIDYVHGLVTTLKTALVHPVMQSLPVGARTAMALFRNIHSALGLININFPDSRRDGNSIALDTDAAGSRKLLVSYQPDAREPEVMEPMIKRFRRFLLSLGCIAPPNMTRMRPMGASVHYAGTLPMSNDGGDYTTDRAGRMRPFQNLIFADGSTFPSLPAKNLTFTLMANASRIARESLAS
jgi:choline dehydrogenase-like flavoprotein